jgi:hypothetical protein
MPIPFTQYIRPHGERKRIEIRRPDAIEAMAQELQAKGYTFSCEDTGKRTRGIISFTVESPHEGEGDIVIKLVRNGPAVPVAVDELVKEAYKKVCGPCEATRKRQRYPKYD